MMALEPRRQTGSQSRTPRVRSCVVNGITRGGGVGNTAGAANGTVDWWLAGVKIGSHSGFSTSPEQECGRNELDPPWGGGGSVVSSTMSMVVQIISGWRKVGTRIVASSQGRKRSCSALCASGPVADAWRTRNTMRSAVPLRVSAKRLRLCRLTS